MTLDANKYATTPLSSGTASQSAATQTSEFASLEVYNNQEIELVSTARGATKLLSTLIGIGRQKNGGEFKDLGLTEMISTNFPEFKFLEQNELQTVFVKNGAEADTTETALVFDSTAGLIVGNILRNIDTNEQFRVSAVNIDGVTITVQRAVGTVSAAAIADNAKFLVIGTAIEKGVASVGTVGVDAVSQSNYFQKFITTVSTTDFDNLAFRVKDAQSMNVFMKERAIIHYQQLERAALFGQKKAGTIGGQPYYTMEGVIEFAKRGWTHDISGGLTRSSLEEILTYPLRYTNAGNYTKLMICGSKARAKISELFEARLSATQIKDIDLTLDTIKINTGEFIIIDHPFLDENSGYEKHIVIVDPAFLKVVYPSGKDLNGVGFNGKTKFIYNKSVETFAYQEGSYVTYMSMMNANANSAGLFKIVA